jgi:hypothetical protein
MEAALSADDLAPVPARPSVDLRGEVGAVVADMRARGLTVYFKADDIGDAARSSGRSRTPCASPRPTWRHTREPGRPGSPPGTWRGEY